MVEFAEECVVLPEKESRDRHGPFSIGFTPYMAGPLNAYGDPDVEQITIVSSTQVGKTMAIIVCILYVIDQTPGRVVWIMPREDDANLVIDERLKPIMAASPKLRHHYQSARWTRELCRFPHMSIHKGWAGSEAAVQSWPAPFILMDELSSWAQKANAAHPVKSAKQRTVAQLEPKILTFSTPKFESDMVWSEFEKSSQERCHLPCVHCGEFQTLDFSRERLRIPADERDPERVRTLQLAKYHCVHCDAEITHQDKLSGLERCVWAPKGCTVDRDGNIVGDVPKTSHRGFQLSALYSTFVTFSRVMAEFLEANRSGDLQSFYNYWLGLPFKEYRKAPEDQQIKKCRRPYKRGTVPSGVLALTGGIDVQKAELVWEVRGWGVDGTWLIDCGVESSWKALERKVCKYAWPRADGMQAMPVEFALIDWQGVGGDRQDEVAAFCRRWEGRVVPCRGVETITGGLMSRSVNTARASYRSKIRTSGIPTYVEVGTHRIKEEVQRKCRNNDGFFLPDDCPADYMHQLNSEQKEIEKDNRGNPKPVWKPRWENHFFDTCVYAHAAADEQGILYELSEPEYGDEVDPGSQVEGPMAIASRMSEGSSDEWSDWSADDVDLD